MTKPTKTKNSFFRCHDSFRMVGLIVLVITLCTLVNSEARALNPLPSYQVQTAGAAPQECISCPFFVEMDRIKSVWSTKLFNAIAVQLNDILYTFVLLYFSWMALMFIVQPSKVGERVAKLPMTFLVIALIGITLSPTSMSYTDNSTSMVWYFLMGPLENASLELGKLIVDISGSRSTQLSGTDSHYAYLAASVEGQIWHITDLAGIIMFGKHGGILTILKSVPRIVAGLILLLPYLFVIGVFFAFLVEALFKYISITIVSPLLVFSMIWTRMFAVAGARVVLGAALTVVFASGAMSLTVEVVGTQGAVIKEKVDNSEKRKAIFQDEYDNIGCRVGTTNPNHPKYIPRSNPELSGYCKELNGKIQNSDSITVFQREYFMLVVIGFVSILLHLGSKALASQISGAQESSTGAASVTAAMMAAGGAAWGASKYGTVLAGRGMARAAPSMFSGASGAVGGLAGMAAGSMGAQNGFSEMGNSRRIPTGNFDFGGNESGGLGSAASSNVPDTSQQLSKLSQSIDKLVKQLSKGGEK